MPITTLVDKKRVFVAMSGGVDSSVAAALLKKEGYEVIGAHMRCWNLDGCAEQDAEDARRAAEVLGIPFYVFDFEKEYKDKVVNYMIDGYRKGITPNPDVMCNKEIKFGLFFKKAMEMGANYVATGHYVRLMRKSQIPNPKFQTNPKSQIPKKNQSPIANYQLRVAKDRNKDQSYFLWTLKPEQLKRCLFPIGEYKKPQVRKLAKRFGLLNAEKKDSQGICFLGQVSLPDFLKKYIRPKTGAIINDSGEVIGQHHGAHLYTIGQRRGLNIGGTLAPLYVAEKNVRKNVLVVAEGDGNQALYRKQIDLVQVNLLNQELGIMNQGKIAIQSLPVYIRVRYRQPLEMAMLNVKRDKIKKRIHSLKFDRPVKFVAAGQSAVFYDNKGTMLGGGVII